MAAATPLTRVFRRPGLEAFWLGGGLYVQSGSYGLLLDAPAGVANALEPLDALPRLRTIALSGGRIQSVGGLVPLLCALEPHHDEIFPISVWGPLGEERPAVLAEAWTRGWPDRYPVTIETAAPGSVFEVGPMEIATFAIRRGEPRWRPPVVDSVPAVAFRVTVDEVTVVWIPGAAPSEGQNVGALERLVRGADLAVVEVGVRPWPASSLPWRLTVEQAIRGAAGAGELWLVGDDGRPVGGGPT